MVGPVLGSEAYAFAYCFEVAFTLQVDTFAVLNETVQIPVSINPDPLFNSIVRYLHTSRRGF